MLIPEEINLERTWRLLCGKTLQSSCIRGVDTLSTPLITSYVNCSPSAGSGLAALHGRVFFLPCEP